MKWVWLMKYYKWIKYKKLYLLSWQVQLDFFSNNSVSAFFYWQTASLSPVQLSVILVSQLDVVMSASAPLQLQLPVSVNWATPSLLVSIALCPVHGADTVAPAMGCSLSSSTVMMRTCGPLTGLNNGIVGSVLSADSGIPANELWPSNKIDMANRNWIVFFIHLIFSERLFTSSFWLGFK